MLDEGASAPFNPSNLLNSNSNLRSWASAHTDQGRRKRASPGPLRFLNCALSLNRDGRVSVTTVIAANSAAPRFSPFGLQPAQTPRGFAPLPRRRFECGPDILKANTVQVLILNFKELRPCSKCHRQVGGETTFLPLARTRSREARRADILRLLLWPLKHGHCDQRSCRCYRRKKRRIPKEVRLNLLWARVGGEPTVLTLKFCLAF